MSFSGKAIAACALIILACIGVLSFWSEVQNEEDRAWVRQTYLVVEKLQTLRIEVAQAETSQRDFTLTGLDRYLVLYGTNVRQARRDMKELADLIADNPDEREAMKRLDTLIGARFGELEGGIEIRKRSGFLSELPDGFETIGRAQSSDPWTGQIARMRHTEAELLSGRLDRAAAGTRKIKLVIVFGNTLSILILLGKGFVIHKEAGKRNLAEQNLKQANERLERRTTDLSETNIELESFAYSVAHDLRAPLRHIAGYSNVLVQDHGPRLDAEGRRYLGKIAGGAEKMGRLVDDLLNLSRIGRQKLLVQDTPLDSLVAQVVEDLRPECSDRDVEWRIESLFSAECDLGLMRQVFANLLSNSVKYTRRREHAVIQVGQMNQGGQRVVFVRDNGAGFEMQYARKLFGVFQRLHKARDFEGTGVGLAIVQRIIQKHGGRIWAEAELDQGATFFFTIGSPENHMSKETELLIVEEAIHGGPS